MKNIDLTKTVYELTEEYPELIEVLKGLGFLGVVNPEMRETHGKVMTLIQGCKNLGIELEDVINKLKEKGFTVKNTK